MYKKELISLKLKELHNKKKETVFFFNLNSIFKKIKSVGRNLYEIQ